jgi:hypothetical protein
MDNTVFAYLAGAMDSDGYFGIKKSTYHRRIRGDAVNPSYSERIGLKQITPEVPELLKATFGGHIYQSKGQTENSKPLWTYQASDLNAAKACVKLLPFLLIKKRQVELALELRESKNSKYLQHSYWFEKEFPDWQKMELITTEQANKMLGYGDHKSIAQCVSNGTILATPYDRSGICKPRIPKVLIERLLLSMSRDGRPRNQPPQLVEWRESLWNKIRELNKMGINGTPIFHRTGCYSLKT